MQPTRTISIDDVPTMKNETFKSNLKTLSFGLLCFVVGSMLASSSSSPTKGVPLKADAADILLEDQERNRRLGRDNSKNPPCDQVMRHFSDLLYSDDDPMAPIKYGDEIYLGSSEHGRLFGRGHTGQSIATILANCGAPVDTFRFIRVDSTDSSVRYGDTVEIHLQGAVSSRIILDGHRCNENISSDYCDLKFLLNPGSRSAELYQFTIRPPVWEVNKAGISDWDGKPLTTMSSFVLVKASYNKVGEHDPCGMYGCRVAHLFHQQTERNTGSDTRWSGYIRFGHGGDDPSTFVAIHSHAQSLEIGSPMGELCVNEMKDKFSPFGDECWTHSSTSTILNCPDYSAQYEDNLGGQGLPISYGSDFFFATETGAAVTDTGEAYCVGHLLIPNVAQFFGPAGDDLAGEAVRYGDTVTIRNGYGKFFRVGSQSENGKADNEIYYLKSHPTSSTSLPDGEDPRRFKFVIRPPAHLSILEGEILKAGMPFVIVRYAWNRSGFCCQDNWYGYRVARMELDGLIKFTHGGDKPFQFYAVGNKKYA